MRHLLSPAGDSREHAVRCPRCQTETWNVCAMCDDCCQHGAGLSALFSAPRIDTDEHGRHTDEHGRVHQMVEVGTEVTYVSTEVAR